MTTLSKNTYGKSRVRLVKVGRSPGSASFHEWTVGIRFEGDFEAAFTAGDNSLILPTDTMKNTVYSLARASGAETPEAFGKELAAHFLGSNEQVSSVQIEIAEKPWEHLTPTTFRQAGLELKTAVVTGTRAEKTVRSGLSDLIIMKTAHSGFSGYRKDRLTTLRETSDRLLGTSLRAEWTYRASASSFQSLRAAIRKILLDTFAAHESLSVQHTLYAMGEAVLDAIPEVTDIRLMMPNLHCLLVDLTPFGQDNPNEIFVPVDEPHGAIEAEIRRS